MTRVAIVRCEKNDERCPMTSCLKCLHEGTEGFSVHDRARLVGVFTCRCPGSGVAGLAAILKAKGAEAIHLCTCAFAGKADGVWTLEDGLCHRADELLAAMHEATGLPCVKGTAHLPPGYAPRVLA